MSLLRREILSAFAAGALGWEVARQVAKPLTEIAISEVRHIDYDYWFNTQSSLHTDLNGDPNPAAYGRHNGSTIILTRSNIPPTIGRLMDGNLNVWRFRLPNNLEVEVQDYEQGIGRLTGQTTPGLDYVMAKTLPSTSAADAPFTMDRERRFSAKIVIKEVGGRLLGIPINERVIDTWLMYFPTPDEVPLIPLQPIKPVFFYGRNISVSVDEQPDPLRGYDPQKFHPARILWEK